MGSSSSRIVGALLWWGQDPAMPGPPGIRKLPDLHLGSIPGQGVEGLNYQPDQGRVRLLSAVSRTQRRQQTFIHTLKDTHSHALRHTDSCTHWPRAGPGLSVQRRQTRPGPARLGLWAGPWRGCGRGLGGAGRGPTRCCPISPDTKFLMQEQTKRSGPEGSAQLEAVLTLGLPVWRARSVCWNCPSRKQTSQAANA